MSPDEAAATLTQHWGTDGWDLYRGMSGKWMIRITDPETRRSKTADDDTIAGVFKAAVDVRFLTAVPPRPEMVGNCEIRKSGRDWRVHEDGRFVNSHDRKMDAAAFIERFREARQVRCEDWNERFAATVLNGAEGETFEWVEGMTW